MARDALETEVDPLTGELVFTNLPRLPDGTPDWERLGGERPYRVRGPDGRVHLIDLRPSVPDPRQPDGRPTRPT